MAGNRWKALTPEQRFWTHVDDQEGSCWVWMGARFPTGYGHLVFRGKDTYAHRVAWELMRGPIPAGLHVLHRCDNPPCVNPDHLMIGTHADNMADMSAKGRARTRRKLTLQQAAEIRAAHRAGERLSDIATRYGVSVPTVSEIGHGRKWARALDGAA